MSDYRQFQHALIRTAIHGKWRDGSNWSVSPQMQKFYRFKAVICLLLNREPRKGTDVFEHIQLAYIASGVYAPPGEPTVHWFEALVIGHGIFRNWWVTLYSDSD